MVSCHSRSLECEVVSIVRDRYCLSPTDEMKVTPATWDILMSVTLQTAVHLGEGYAQSLRPTRNQPKKTMRQLFQVTERLIFDQTASS